MWVPVSLIAICLVGLVVFAFVYVPARYHTQWESWRQNLTVRVDARRSAIESWIEREEAEAAALGSLPAVTELVSAPVASPHTVAHARDVLVAFARAHRYRRIGVFDHSGRALLIAPGAAPADSAMLIRQAVAALRAGSRSSDLVIQPGESSERIYFRVALEADNQLRGALLFEADPKAWLFPFLVVAHSAPSSAALLVRRTGDSLVFLEPGDSTAPSRITRLAMMDRGHEELFSGRRDTFGIYTDQAGTDVIGLAMPVTGWSWSIVLKVDRAAAFDGFWGGIVAKGLLLLVLMVSVAGTILTLWWGLRQATSATAAKQRTRFARALDHARDAMLIAGVDGRILDVNIAMEQLTGLSRERLVGRHIAEDAVPKERRTARAALSAVLRAGEAVCESAIRSGDGRIVPVEVSGRTSLLDDERIIIAIIRDISERRMAQDREQQLMRILRTRSEINQLIVRELDPGTLWSRACRVLAEHGGFRLVWILLPEPDGRLRPVACCGEARSYTDGLEVRWDDTPAGSGPAGCAVRTGSMILRSVRDTKLEPWLERAAAHGLGSSAAVPLTVEGKVRAVIGLYMADPDAFTTDMCALIQDLGGDLGHALAAIEQREALAMAQVQAARSAAALEQTAEAAIITDPTGMIVQVNPAFERITGYTSAEIGGKNPRILKSGRQDAAFYTAMWSKLRSGEIWSGEVTNLRKDGRAYIAETVISPVRGADGTIVHYVGLQRDVTEERALTERLRQVQRVEELGKLTGGIAHDFNNLLTVVLSNLSLAEAELGPVPVPVRDYLADIGEASRRGGAMVRKLLAVGRQGRLVLATADPGQVVRDAERMLRRVIPENVEISTDIEPYLPAIHADVGAIEQMLLNLATNARDAMPDGGRLVIGVRREVLGAEAARAENVPAGSYVVISADDTGMGMDEATQRRVFEPFFTTKPVGKGTGLGLAMVFGLVRQHGGFIQVTSALGRGTSMRLCFPASAGQAAPCSQAAAAAPAQRGNERILLVEDEAPLRLAGTRVLSRLGYTVVQAAHGEEAWEIFQREADTLDLVLSDAVMPKMSGLALLGRIRESGSAVPFLLTSGYAEGISDAPSDLPAPPIIAKPWSPGELSSKVRQMLDEAGVRATHH